MTGTPGGGALEKLMAGCGAICCESAGSVWTTCTNDGDGTGGGVVVVGGGVVGVGAGAGGAGGAEGLAQVVACSLPMRFISPVIRAERSCCSWLRSTVSCSQLSGLESSLSASTSAALELRMWLLE